MTALDGLELRRATVGDAPRLHEIVAAAGRAMAAQGFDNWLSPDPTERFVEDITTREVYVVLTARTGRDQTLSGNPIATFTLGTTARRPYSPEP